VWFFRSYAHADEDTVVVVIQRSRILLSGGSVSGSTINVKTRTSGRRPWIREHAVSLAFLTPAAIWLLFIVIYPTIDTIRLSLFNESATKFLGLTNYKTVFSTDTILTAFRNNVIWVLIFPFFVTFLGLIFAVLTERIRWATAFKALIVMPIVFSTTASAWCGRPSSITARRLER
jgi:alpha-glucoside transport system permease protein